MLNTDINPFKVHDLATLKASQVAMLTEIRGALKTETPTDPDSEEANRFETVIIRILSGREGSLQDQWALCIALGVMTQLGGPDDRAWR